jgi:hypothetical protein
MESKMSQSDRWVEEFIKGAAKNAAARLEAELPDFERAVAALRRLANVEERARALHESERLDREEGPPAWWYREQGIWEAVNGCGKTYHDDGIEVRDGDLCPACNGTGLKARPSSQS